MCSFPIMNLSIELSCTKLAACFMQFISSLVSQCFSGNICSSLCICVSNFYYVAVNLWVLEMALLVWSMCAFAPTRLGTQLYNTDIYLYIIKLLHECTLAYNRKRLSLRFWY